MIGEGAAAERFGEPRAFRYRSCRVRLGGVPRPSGRRPWTAEGAWVSSLRCANSDGSLGPRCLFSSWTGSSSSLRLHGGIASAAAVICVCRRCSAPVPSASGKPRARRRPSAPGSARDPSANVGRGHAARPTSDQPVSTAELEAARLLLDRLGIRPEQLLAAPGPVAARAVPSVRHYLDRVADAVSPATRRVYGPYWRRVACRSGVTAASTKSPRSRSSSSPSACGPTSSSAATPAAAAARPSTSSPRCAACTATPSPTASSPSRQPGRPCPQATPARQHPPRPPRRRTRARSTRRRRTTGNDPDPRRAAAAPAHRDRLPARRRPRPAAGPTSTPTSALVRLREKGETRALATGLTRPDARTCVDHASERGAAGRPSRCCATATAGRSPAAATTTSGTASASSSRGSPPSRHQHPLAAPHHPDLGRTPLRLRQSPAPTPATPAQRRGHHLHLRPSRHRRGRRRTRRPHRRAPSRSPGAVARARRRRRGVLCIDLRDQGGVRVLAGPMTMISTRPFGNGSVQTSWPDWPRGCRYLINWVIVPVDDRTRWRRAGCSDLPTTGFALERPHPALPRQRP